ncbi:hypothetical protein FA95DRAFT_1525981 [Auriscalpium vulgare]|uniref:Uncharacterized protein n=1 Tax=Auriscalpium vulgare TaxID=40419 RepID=A0ACB8RE75_9AGAM|nr:hypothetical protein FA95DRAFT_1525981 [Auriscalpium vulgare]
MSSAFFYGTLMHPKILKRVIDNEGSHLEICPAVLMDYTRHHVKDADYPAILPHEKSEKLLKRELNLEEKSVRGTLVTGLTESDLELLDIFEGNEYVRTLVAVHPLGPSAPLPSDVTPTVESAYVPTTPAPLPSPSELTATATAETYVWKAPVTDLEQELWSFETFVRDNAWKWVGEGAEKQEEYQEVDRRKEMRGEIVR